MARFEKVFNRLDEYIEQRMRVARTPGMSVALTDREKLVRVSTHGVNDLGTQDPVTPDTLFEIGSISKSFTAVAVLQAYEAGFLDLHAPVIDYLPWFRVSSQYAPITIHHLLSHSAGLIASADFSPDPRGVVWGLRETEATFPPGEQYHYSEVGYQILTLVLQEVRGQPLGDVIQAGILDPLGMTATEPAITHDIRPRLAKGYRYLYDDRPMHCTHPLVPASWFEMNSGDGCIASTAEDMAKYMRMLLNRGQGPCGPIISDESYSLMTQPIIEEKGYGYGLVVFELEGLAHIGHGGDMPGYEAYMQMDAENGLGMAMVVTQPYPSGLCWDVLKFFRAAYLDKALPTFSSLPDSTHIERATDFVGIYCGEGKPLTLVADNGRLLLDRGDERIVFEARGVDCFYVNHPDFDRYLLRFGRADEGASDGEQHASVVEAFHGPDWYTNDRYAGPRDFLYPLEWEAYVGHYCSHNPWQSNFRVVVRKGELLLVWPSGDEESLISLKDGRFRVGEEDFSPERLRFDQVVSGQAWCANLSGCDYYRFFTP